MRIMIRNTNSHHGHSTAVNTIIPTLLVVLYMSHVTTTLCNALIHETRPDLDSCTDYDIVAGNSLEEDCETYCFPQEFETFDYAVQSETENSLVRNTVCRCFGDESDLQEAESNGVILSVGDDGRIKTFECWTEAEVWDTTTPAMPCGEVYNITSLSTCQSFCQTIDPLSFQFSGTTGSIRCACADFVVCNDSSAASGPSSRGRTTMVTSTLIALACSIAATLL
mmetsp:Transcript_21958/g.51768  ORF Transcript_21958/g.51768 Transcript_21958/m.51768 type:complete len:224 (-) Transcript_21958:152-823(-)